MKEAKRKFYWNMTTPASTSYRTLAVGLLIGSLSLLIPLLRDLHWESAGLASLIASFYGGVTSTTTSSSRRTLRKGLGLIIGWMVPLLIYALWTNCFSFDGLAYWILGPLPSLIFGGSIGRLSRSFRLTYKRFYTILILSAVTIIPTLIEFSSFPQLYFFNHVWSYWPGPIYDEIIHFDTRLIGFRSLTFFWILVLWAIPDFLENRLSRWILLAGMTAIMFSYLNASAWGLISPEERLQNQLGNVVETEHFLIFYPADISRDFDQAQQGTQHESYLAEITDILELDMDHYRSNKIHSYIYSNDEQKKRLTGAGRTSYVPVWLQQDQTHISFNSLNNSLKHELVHIIAKRFGNWFGASTSIGLVEGLAVALSADRPPTSVDHLVAARPDWPNHEEMRSLFNPAGFYQTAGPVSYVISGSFVRHLINHYPVDHLKRAYQSGSLESAYSPLNFNELIGTWHTHLDTISVDSEDRIRAAELFSTPSILEKPCPRVEKKRELQAFMKRNLTTGQHADPDVC